MDLFNDVKILAINTGSTSTKIAVYKDKRCIFLKTIRHSAEELNQYEKLGDQFQYRKKVILQELGTENIGPGKINIIIARGGLTKPLESGIYEINQEMIDDLNSERYGVHASNLSPMIAFDLAQKIPNTSSYISDPVVTDEMDDIARISGHPIFERKSIFHALNQKAVARLYARNIHKRYEDLNLIVVHMGGGVSIGAHKLGRVCDVNNALDGEGPFSPERSGSIPAGQLVELCFSGKYTKNEIKKILVGKGGLYGHVQTTDAKFVQEKALDGEQPYKDLQDAMCYQIAKYIGEMATVFYGKVDAIILTGGIAYNNDLVNAIKHRVEFIAPISVYPGEDEMSAMAMNVELMLEKQIPVRHYK